jgi:cytosine/adenosine deaminase-related metal-dependent hydrolase
MATLLVKNAHTLVTMDAQRREISNGALYLDGPVIEQVGPTDTLPSTADDVLDLKGRHLLMPGLINTHHHFYQVLTRAVPAAQNCELFDWLKTLYPIWSKLTSEGVYVSAQMAAAELMLSGCTTSSDHLYLFPNDCSLDDEIRAMRDIGMRFHASRGSMSVGVSKGGLPPDSLVEDEDQILKDSQRLIEAYHDNARHSMTRLTLAPCSPFSVSPNLMEESATLARTYPGVRLHTHLAENDRDVRYSLENFNRTPGEYAESLGWTGSDVWHAHCVQLDDAGLQIFARSKTGVAHCPTSNMRLGSGAAPIRKMLAAGIAVGLGVDGAASNDASHLFHEARAAMLLSRLAERDATAMTARTALELATCGGAEVLGRDDIGHLAPGMCADFVAINIDRPSFAGAWDLVAALVLCDVDTVDYSFINGRKVIDRGRLIPCDIEKLIETTNVYSRKLAL